MRRFACLTLLLVAGCGGDEPTPPAARVATTLVAVTPAADTLEAGRALAHVPTVRVLDQDGRPLAGVAVAFSVVGAGTTLARTTDTTDADGRASSGTWTTGSVPGRYEVQARVGVLPPVLFVTVVRLGAPAAILDVTPTPVPTRAYAALAPSPVVKVVDRAGNAVPGVAVDFAIQVPVGQAPGSSLAQARIVTDADGRASPGEWLPRTNERHRLSATVEGGPSIVLTRTVQRACVPDRLLVPPVVVVDTAGSFEDPGCGYWDLHGIESASTVSIRATVTSMGPDGRPLVQLNARPIVRRIDQFDTTNPWQWVTPTGAQSLRLLLPAGDYGLAVLPATPTGESNRLPYELRVEPVGESVTGCEDVFVRVGLGTSQSIAASDCAVAAPELGGAMRGDRFRFDHRATPTNRFTATVTAEAFEPRLALYQRNSWTDPWVLVAADAGTGNRRTLDVVVPRTGRELMFTVLAPDGSTGSYRLDITSTP